MLIDSFDGFEQSNWGPMRFGPMVSAPDGRIYIVPSAGSSKYLHVIDRPDLPDTSCRFLQHHINLEIWNGRSAPNIPNFRLGALDDSHCDTLGINNLPVSRWRYEADNADVPLSIRFTDLSFFDPQHWYWDFDNGFESEEKSPVYNFEPGLYHVCLTVSNEYAMDSSCQWIEVMSTSIQEEKNKSLPEITITPNPFVDYIELHSLKDGYKTSHLQLYDIHGRLIFDDPSVIIPSKLFFPDFPPGMYLGNLTDEDGKTFSFKMMKK